MSILTPPNLFRANAMHAYGDPWVADGVHIRISASPTLGFPIHPFVAIPLLQFQYLDLLEEQNLPLDVDWYDRRGVKIPSSPFHLEDTGPVRGLIQGRGQQATTPDWCYLAVEAHDPEVYAELLDRRRMPFGPIVMATRSSRPYAFAAAHLAQLRLSGRGRIEGLRGLHEQDVLTDNMGQTEVFGLPIDGSRWYAPYRAQDALSMAKDRLRAGQGRRLGPAELPVGSFPAAVQDDDLNNLFEHLAPLHINPWLSAAYFPNDPLAFPSTAEREFTGSLGVQEGKAVFPAWNMLLSMTADPRIARYLGFSTVLREPDFAREGKPVGWLVAGEFAMPRSSRRALRRAGITLPPPTDHWLPSMLRSRFDELFPDAPRVRSAVEGGRQITIRGWDVVTMFTIAAAVISAPPDPPSPPRLELAAPGRWNAGKDGIHWMQSIALLGQPPTGTLGYARADSTGLTPLHKYIPTDDPIHGRATALVAHWSEDPPVVKEQLYPQPLNGMLWTPPTLTDTSIPTRAGGASWRVWQSDTFGRWSEAAEISAPLPAQPLPPPPVPELDWRPGDAMGSDPASPGTMNVRIGVPGLAQLEPGALPIEQMEITIDDGQPEVVALNDEGEVILTFDAAKTSPGGKTLFKVSAVFIDTDGRRSPTDADNGKAERWVFDPRPVVPGKTAPTILWSGRPDPTGKAELALQWRAPTAEALYRVYLGDQYRLAKKLGLEGANLSTRAEWADAIFHAAKNGALNDKKQFSLLTETPLKPGASNVVTFQHQLPGGLRGVQLIRIVPVTEAGVEADFASCGLVPIAVPLTEQPPAPTVHVTPTPDGLKVQVLAYGLTDALLKAHGASAEHPPEFRVRRARERITESIYLTAVKQGPLSPPEPGAGVGAPWTAEFIDQSPLPTYVEYSWLAEVRYPCEPAKVAGADDLASPLLVRSMFTGTGPDAESAWSSLSLPAPLMLVETNGPQAVAQASAVRQTDGSVKLLVENIPAIHQKAIGPCQVSLWTWVQDGSGEKLLLPPAGSPPEQTAVTQLTVPRGTTSIEYNDATPGVTGYSIACVDPLGRQGQLIRVAVSDENE